MSVLPIPTNTPTRRRTNGLGHKPTLFTPETIKIILTVTAAGGSMEAASGQARVSVSVLEKWLEEGRLQAELHERECESTCDTDADNLPERSPNANFYLDFKQAESEDELAYLKRLKDITDKRPNAWAGEMTLRSRRNRHRYGDRQKQFALRSRYSC